MQTIRTRLSLNSPGARARHGARRRARVASGQTAVRQHTTGKRRAGHV